jgi:hypothetical protein
MYLLSVGEILWRHKRFTIPVLILMLLASLYVVEIKPPTYEAKSTVLLTNPPGQATNSQIAADPQLGHVSAFNTFAQYGDLQVVANTMIDLVTSPASQPTLLSEGVSPGYSLAMSTDYGNPPIINVTGVGTTAQSAINSAKLLTQEIQKDLYQIQVNVGINPFYMIKADNFVAPTKAHTSTSGKLRSLVAVLAVGIIVLLLGASLAEVREKRRKGPRRGTDLAMAAEQTQPESVVAASPEVVSKA